MGPEPTTSDEASKLDGRITGIGSRIVAMSDAHVTIVPTRNGPYEVTGEVSIVAPDGTVIRETAKTYLCRCGRSARKPFCDSSHHRLNWVADAEG